MRAARSNSQLKAAACVSWQLSTWLRSSAEAAFTMEKIIGKPLVRALYLSAGGKPSSLLDAHYPATSEAAEEPDVAAVRPGSAVETRGRKRSAPAAPPAVVVTSRSKSARTGCSRPAVAQRKAVQPASVPKPSSRRNQADTTPPGSPDKSGEGSAPPANNAEEKNEGSPAREPVEEEASANKDEQEGPLSESAAAPPRSSVDQFLESLKLHSGRHDHHGRLLVASASLRGDTPTPPPASVFPLPDISTSLVTSDVPLHFPASSDELSPPTAADASTPGGSLSELHGANLVEPFAQRQQTGPVEGLSLEALSQRTVERYAIFNSSQSLVIFHAVALGGLLEACYVRLQDAGTSDEAGTLETRWMQFLEKLALPTQRYCRKLRALAKHIGPYPRLCQASISLGVMLSRDREIAQYLASHPAEAAYWK